MVFTVGAAGSLLRWLLHKTEANARLDPRVFLNLAFVMLALALICGTIALIP
jgi:hypothetical protein